MSLVEVAYLAALQKRRQLSPIRKTKAAINRRNWVLWQMASNGYISNAEAEAASTQPLSIAAQSGFDAANAPYFTEEVRRALINEYGDEMLYAGGLSVRTTLIHFYKELRGLRCNRA